MPARWRINGSTCGAAGEGDGSEIKANSCPNVFLGQNVESFMLERSVHDIIFCADWCTKDLRIPRRMNGKHVLQHYIPKTFSQLSKCVCLSNCFVPDRAAINQTDLPAQLQYHLNYIQLFINTELISISSQCFQN